MKEEKEVFLYGGELFSILARLLVQLPSQLIPICNDVKDSVFSNRLTCFWDVIDKVLYIAITKRLSYCIVIAISQQKPIRNKLLAMDRI